MILYKPVELSQWIKQWEDELTQNRIKILIAINENPSISKEELSNIIGISTTAIDNNIKWLRTHGLLKRTGGNKGGRWKMADPI